MFDGKIYFIVGPTGSGKTSLSIQLAKKIGSAEIISADSRQIFTDFNLTTGKVTTDEMENIPHHLLDIVTPGTDFSVYNFTELALTKVQEIFARGNTPIVCGGTGYYVDNILYKYNLSEVNKNEELRTSLEGKRADVLLEILEKLDSKYAKIIDKNNSVRLVRAIELATALGAVPPLEKLKRFADAEFVFTDVPRDILCAKIIMRISSRIDSGMLGEFENVKNKYKLTNDYLEKLGLEFKWINKFLNKKISKIEMIENLFIDTCKYARRQDTWFRRYKKYK